MAKDPWEMPDNTFVEFIASWTLREKTALEEIYFGDAGELRVKVSKRKSTSDALKKDPPPVCISHFGYTLNFQYFLKTKQAWFWLEPSAELGTDKPLYHYLSDPLDHSVAVFYDIINALDLQRKAGHSTAWLLAFQFKPSDIDISLMMLLQDGMITSIMVKRDPSSFSPFLTYDEQRNISLQDLNFGFKLLERIENKSVSLAPNAFKKHVIFFCSSQDGSPGYLSFRLRENSLEGKKGEFHPVANGAIWDNSEGEAKVIFRHPGLN